jgi:hypothetical protein
MNHREIGMIIMLVGGFMLVITIAAWIANRVDEARGRAEIDEWNDTLAKMKVADYDGNEYGWPSDKNGYLSYYVGEESPYGTEYDPVSDTEEFLAKMRADTDAFIAQFQRDTVAFEHLGAFEDTQPLRAFR